jgi:hypothetical protein
MSSVFIRHRRRTRKELPSWRRTAEVQCERALRVCAKSHPRWKACGASVEVRSGRRPVRAQESKVRFADHTPGSAARFNRPPRGIVLALGAGCNVMPPLATKHRTIIPPAISDETRHPVQSNPATGSEEVLNLYPNPRGKQDTTLSQTSPQQGPIARARRTLQALQS